MGKIRRPGLTIGVYRVTKNGTSVVVPTRQVVGPYEFDVPDPKPGGDSQDTESQHPDISNPVQ